MRTEDGCLPDDAGRARLWCAAVGGADPELTVNWVAAELLALTIGFYVLSIRSGSSGGPRKTS
jgi:hypothetical protein